MNDYLFWLGDQSESVAVDLETFEQRAREAFEIDSTDIDE